MDNCIVHGVSVCGPVLTTFNQQVNLTKDYIEQFKAVLPVQKVAKLMMEEKKIMRELTKCKKNKGKQCPK